MSADAPKPLVKPQPTMEAALETATMRPELLSLNCRVQSTKRTPNVLAPTWESTHRLDGGPRELWMPKEQCIGHPAAITQLHEAKDTFADWQYMGVKGNSTGSEVGTMNINFHFDNGGLKTSVNKTFELSSSIEDIARLVKTELETNTPEARTMFPIHAKAVFAGVATYHKMRAAELIGREDNLRDQIDLFESGEVKHTEKTLEVLSSMQTVGAELLTQLDLAKRAMEFEMMTHGITDSKELAGKLNMALAYKSPTP